jgi:hypothetical protein
LEKHPFAQRLFCDSAYTQTIKKIVNIESPKILLFDYIDSSEQIRGNIDFLLGFESLSRED